MPLLRRSPRSISLSILWVAPVLALALLTGPSSAAEPVEAEATSAKKRLVFPPRQRAKTPKVEAAAAPQSPAPDSPESDEPDPVDEAAAVSVERIVAVEPPTDGIWEFVDQMGEAPSELQVEAIEERAAAELSEKALIDDLSVAEPPMEFYRDPEAVLSADPLFLDRVDPSEFDIPVVVNADVERWVKYFTGDGRKYYKKWLGRSSRYRPMMYEKLEKEFGRPCETSTAEFPIDGSPSTLHLRA